MTAALVAGLLAGLGVALPVGAVAVCLVALSARTSLRTGVAAALGVATADGALALVAVLGGAALADRLTEVAGTVRALSALALLAVAVVLLRSASPPVGAVAVGPTPLRAYGALLALTLLNPLTVVLFTALVVGGTAGEPAGAGAGAAFVVGVVLASAGWQVLLAVGGAALGQALTGERGRVLTGRLSALLLVVLALRLVLPG